MDKIISMFPKNYWKYTDDKLYDLASEYQLISEELLESIAYDIDTNHVNPNYNRNIFNQKTRDMIIEKLMNKDEHFGRFWSFWISVVAIIISILAIFL